VHLVRVSHAESHIRCAVQQQDQLEPSHSGRDHTILNPDRPSTDTPHWQSNSDLGAGKVGCCSLHPCSPGPLPRHTPSSPRHASPTPGLGCRILTGQTDQIRPQDSAAFPALGPAAKWGLAASELWQRLDYLSPNCLLVESFLPHGFCEVALSDWLYSEKQGQGAPWNLNWLFPRVKVENSSHCPSRSEPLPLGAKSGMELGLHVLR
jgi:hypothetical protein